MNYLEAATEKLKSSILEYLTKAGHPVSLDDVFFEKPSNSNHGELLRMTMTKNIKSIRTKYRNLKLKCLNTQKQTTITKLLLPQYFL